MKRHALTMGATLFVVTGCPNQPPPEPPIAPQPESVFVAYVSGSVGAGPGRLVVRASNDGGVTWTDRSPPDRLQPMEPAPRGAGLALDAAGLGTLLMWGLGPHAQRLRYALGTQWQSTFVDQTAANADDVLAPSIAPFGTDGASWLVAVAARPPGSAEGSDRFARLWVQAAEGAGGGAAPQKELMVPLPSTTPIDGRPAVFARRSSKVLYAVADRPEPAPPGFLRVGAGTVRPQQRDILWDPVPTPIRPSEGDFGRHRVVDLCLTGDGGSRYWLGVLLAGTNGGGPEAGRTTTVIRLYRTENGRTFQRVQFVTHQEFPIEFYLNDPKPSALACALLPGHTEVMLGTLARDDAGAVVAQMHRVRASGEIESVPFQQPESGPFAFVPQVLPFAMVSSGGSP